MSTTRQTLDVARRVCAAIRDNSDRGRRAALRRPDNRTSGAFWVEFDRQGCGDHLLSRRSQEDDEAAWSVAFSVAAILADLHDVGVSLGDALAKARYSEERLVRLTRARGERLHDEVRMAARFLAAKSQPVDAADFARLLFHGDDERFGVLPIARPYYRTLHNQDSKES